MNVIQSEIYSNGKMVSTNIVSLDIMQAVNKVPYAQVVLCEGGKEDKSLVEMSNENCFKTGEELEIVLAQGQLKGSFKGLVVRQNLKKTADNTLLTIDIKDTVHKLTLLRRSAVYTNKEDRQIIADIAKTKNIETTWDGPIYTQKQLVQYYCTDWDFILSRAEANGVLVCPENGKLNFKKVDFSAASTDITDIYEYEFETDTSAQYQAVESVCWDIKNTEPIRFKNTNQVSLKSKHDINAFAKAMGTEKCELVSGIYGEKEEMEAWANALMIKNRHSLLRGRLSIKGNPQLKLGDTILIDGLGNMFNGTALITGIRHRINIEGWVTDIQCGLSSRWFYQNDDLIEKPATGLLPGINGLQIGIVEAFPSDGDPDKFNRIKIRIPAVDKQDSVIWARLGVPYAGDNRGMFWIPETGDEVVVGFLNDDPRHAVVLGSLYNGKTKPPLNFTDTNNEKGIISRNGIKVVFTDENQKEKLVITTPAGNKVLFEDENGITVEDKNKNKLTLTDKGIAIVDKNKNKITADDKGITVEDTNKNVLTLSNQGFEIKDLNNKTMTFGSAGIVIQDTNGNKIALEETGITVQSRGTVTIKGKEIDLN